MSNYVADDAAFINARLKEIEAEKAATRAKPDPEAAKPATPAPAGATGGFVAPGGDYYDPYCG